MFTRRVGMRNTVWWGDVFLFTIVLLFGIILLHEFGHCFGARGWRRGEVLIWPLGGLALRRCAAQPRAISSPRTGPR